MEEGPEPQEWVERAAEEHHHGHTASVHEHGPHTVPAITAAVLAVLASLGSLLSGHAANEAILGMTRASDHWAYFQSKSTKGHLYEAAAEIVSALGQAALAAPEAKPDQAVARLRAEAKRYEGEKAEIEREAQRIQEESRHEFRKHLRFAVGVAAFQVGIVLASVSLLVPLKGLYALSLAAGAVGLVCLVLGVLV
jgi:hypothetical protein